MHIEEREKFGAVAIERGKGLEVLHEERVLLRDELAERRSAVLEVVYLVFNEGYTATSGGDWMRPALCEEALRLGRYHPLDIHRRGNSHRVWLSWYQHYFVWGMTAGIIRELALQIGARP